MRLLVLLAVLQAGCLSESDEAALGLECGPRDLTPECCLKKNPGQWERCTGSSEMAWAAGTVGKASPLMKAAAVGTVVVMGAPQSGKWEHMHEDMMSQIVTHQGWSGLRGTIEPDVVLLDANKIGHRTMSIEEPSK